LRAQSPINQRVSLKHLTSKLLAGGLTAGIVLIWWPTQFPTTGIEALVARGILATLGFELMMLSFAAVEDRVLARLSRRSTRLHRLRERAAATPRPARTGFVLAAGGAALIVPVLALASSGAPRVTEAHATQVVQPVRERVVRQVVVKHRVIHDEVVVPVASTPPAPAAAAPAPSPTPSRPKPAPQTASAAKPTAPAKRPAARAEDTTTAAPATTTPPATTTTPAAPTTVDADAATAAAEPVTP
jgi:hypothetical protein